MIRRKIFLTIALLFLVQSARAQFNDTNDVVRLLGKIQCSGKTSIINNSGLIGEFGGELSIQNIINQNLNFNIDLGMWFGSDINNITGFDFSLGFLYTVKPPFYIFCEFHPRIHNERNIYTEQNIGDEISFYGLSVLGAGYAFNLWRSLYLFTETGFNFFISTMATSSSNASLRNDIQYFILFGLMIRNF